MNNKSEKVRFYYGIFLSVLTAIVGCVFIIQAAIVYYSGDNPYIKEHVGPYLTLPVICLVVWVAAIICGYILSVIYPVKQKKPVYVDDKKTLSALKKRMPEQANDGLQDEFRTCTDELRKKELLRKLVWGFAYGFLLIGAVFIAVYAFDPRNYQNTEWKPVILGIVKNTITWAGAGLIVMIAATIFEKLMVKRELELVKSSFKLGVKTEHKKAELKKNLVVWATVGYCALLVGAIALFVLFPHIAAWILAPFTTGEGNLDKTAAVTIAVAIVVLLLVGGGYISGKLLKKYVPEKANKIAVLGTRIAVGVVAIAFIVAGIFNGGPGDVLAKAAAICMECIGLG